MLTDRELKKLHNNPPGANKRYTDGNRTGFGVQVTPSGTITFYLEYRINNKRKFPKIGKYPFMTLKQARDIAYEWRQLVEQGIDPKEHLNRIKKEAIEREERENARVTVQESCQSYIKYKVLKLASEKAIIGYINRDILPHIGHKKVDELTKLDCRKLVEQKAERFPNMAKKVLGTLKKYLTWCQNQGYITSNPAESIKPSNINVLGNPRGLTSTSRERALSRDEIYCLWNGLDSSGIHTTLKLALKMLLITGVRPGEVLGFSMAEVEGRWWTIPAERRAKTNTPHPVYLNNLALSILKAAQEHNTALQSGFVEDAKNVKLFGSGMKPGSVHSLGQAVRREFRKAKLAIKENRYENLLDFFVIPSTDKKTWTPHDIRRKVRTQLSKMGVNDEVGEAVIGHEKTGMSAVYNQNTYKDQRRDVMTEWNDYLKKIIEGGGT